MIVFLAWLLFVLVFYFRQSTSLFEYVAFLWKHHGSFNLWHPYALKVVASLALAVWIIWIAIQYGGRLLARMVAVASMPRLEQRVLSAGLGFGLVAFVTFALGALHLWYAGVFWAVLIAATAQTAWSDRRNLVAELTTPARQPAGCRATPPLREGEWPVVVALLSITAAIFLLGGLSPEVFYDSLHYHLAVPNLYLINHRIYDLPDLAYSSFVMTVDLAWGFALTVGNEITPKILHGATALLLLLGFIAFERRYLKPGAGVLGALFFLSMPLAGMNVTTAGIDVAVTALQFLAAFTLVRALIEMHEETETRQWLRLAGVFTGLAASCKYTCLPAIPVACAVIVWWKRFKERERWHTIARQLTVFAVPAVLVVVPYFARNIIFHHNPIYPFGATFWGEPRLSAENWQNIANETHPRRLTEFANLGSLIQLALHPWLITINGRTSMDFTGPLLLGLLPLALFARPPGKAYSVLSRYCLALWAVWFLTSSTPRFAMPLFAMASLILAHALLSTGEGLLKRAVLLLCLGVVATNLYFTLFFNANSENWRVLFGQVLERDYLAGAHPTYPAPSYEAFEWMNEHLPAGSKVLVAGDSRTLYAHVRVEPSSIFNSQAIVEIAREASNGDEMARLLRERGITHIFINFGEAVRTESYGVFRWDHQSWAVLEDFWSRYPQLIWVSYRPDPANLKGLFVFKLRSDEESRHAMPAAPDPFLRWKPK